MSFLFVDKILKNVPGKYVSGIKRVTKNDYYLRQNSRGQDVFISSLIGETLGQLAAWNVMSYFDFHKRPVAGICAAANIFFEVQVGQDIMIEACIDKIDNDAVVYHSVAKVDGNTVFTIDSALGPLLPMQDLIDRDLAIDQYQSLLSNAVESAKSPHVPITTPNNNFAGGVNPLSDSPNNCLRSADFVFDSCVVQDGKFIANWYIDADMSYFPDHFPHKPVLPLTVLLEAKANLLPIILAELRLGCNYEIYNMRKIKMNAFVEPGSKLRSEVSVSFGSSDELILQFVTTILDKRVCLVQMLCKKVDYLL